MKILCIEDGSVDIDAIEENGLIDGQVLIYRAGAQKPFVLDVPASEGTYQQMWRALCEEYKYSPFQCATPCLSFDDIRKVIEDIQRKYIGTLPDLRNHN